MSSALPGRPSFGLQRPSSRSRHAPGLSGARWAARRCVRLEAASGGGGGGNANSGGGGGARGNSGGSGGEGGGDADGGMPPLPQPAGVSRPNVRVPGELESVFSAEACLACHDGQLVAAQVGALGGSELSCGSVASPLPPLAPSLQESATVLRSRWDTSLSRLGQIWWVASTTLCFLGACYAIAARLIDMKHQPKMLARRQKCMKRKLKAQRAELRKQRAELQAVRADQQKQRAESRLALSSMAALLAAPYVVKLAKFLGLL